ncbi:MAG: 3-dehydroquinate synthase [Gammaproteobacteria bacterium]|nr:3-dehydroquinate synthase [Gammaproteobacteria bacterium]NNK97775.1 3-dehydroquinate synthase [Xanthomonadales bacterium]
MQTVNVRLAERSYEVFIGSDMLGQPHAAFNIGSGATALVVTNDTVAPLYMDKLIKSLAGVNVHSLVLPDGETYKTQESWSKIIDALIEVRATRDATVITLGGGVIGDMGGFAAASYMRGINFIQVPTTLLAQVDASVGGKTGFNHPSGKNLVGAFHQPASVLVDIRTLDTLPDREFSAGLSEVVKIAAIRDAEFLSWLEEHARAIMAREPGSLTGMIKRSIENKAAVVAEDEREAGVRALLNFGHSFAHAVETLTGYRQFLHGEAVAMGMMVASRLSERRGLCEAGFSERLGNLLTLFDLPLMLPGNLDVDDILETMKLDKKVIAGSVRLILVKSAGQGLIDSASDKLQIKTAIEACQATD